MTGNVATDDYGTLKAELARLLHEGKFRDEPAVAEQTLRTYHAIGRVLDEHLLSRGDRAGYGDRTITRLAGDVGISRASLYQALALFRFRPKFQALGILGWTHYCALLRLPTEAERWEYEAKAQRNGWSLRELEEQIRGRQTPAYPHAGAGSGPREVRESSGAQPALSALKGELYTYRVVGSDTRPRLDLGFGIQMACPRDEAIGCRDGDCATIERTAGGGYRARAVKGRQAAFYSYRARVLDVIDGDTVWLDIDCGFDVWTRQKVRLRGIDTPELGTPDGQRAKDFAVQALSGLPVVAVTTTKPDKYDRYLADIFFKAGSRRGAEIAGEKQKSGTEEGHDAEAVLRSGRFLNRELVKAGLATRFSGR